VPARGAGVRPSARAADRRRGPRPLPRETSGAERLGRLLDHPAALLDPAGEQAGAQFGDATQMRNQGMEACLAGRVEEGRRMIQQATQALRS
jgi:hypothetical protein